MVAIKDMEMPKYCNDCDFVTDSFGYCNRAEEHIPNYEFYSETNERPDFCPLVEVQERKVGVAFDVAIKSMDKLSKIEQVVKEWNDDFQACQKDLWMYLADIKEVLEQE